MSAADQDQAREEAVARPEPSRPGAKKAVLGGLMLMLLAFPLLQFSVGGLNYWLHMLLFMFMYISMTTSWNIIGGFAGYISLGHNVFFAVGGYFSAILFVYFGYSPFITAPIAGLVAMAFALLFGFISLRTRGPAFIISTIALVLVTKITIDNWDYVGGANGISMALVPLPVELVKLPFYYGMLLIAAAAVYTAYRVRHSKLGLGLRAISQDEIKAEVAGIPTRLYKIFAFAISGLYIGMVGALWGYYLSFLRPAIFLTILVGAKLVLMTILGGRGTVAGPVVGAVAYIVINEFFVTQLGSSELNIVATGLLLVIVLLYFPEGIVGTLKKHGRLPRILDWD